MPGTPKTLTTKEFKKKKSPRPCPPHSHPSPLRKFLRSAGERGAHCTRAAGKRGPLGACRSSSPDAAAPRSAGRRSLRGAARSRWFQVAQGVCGGGLPGPLSRGVGAGVASPEVWKGLLGARGGGGGGGGRRLETLPRSPTPESLKKREKATGREPGAAGRRGRVRLASRVRTRRRHCLDPSRCRGPCRPSRSWSHFAHPEPPPLGGATGSAPGSPQGQPTVRCPCPSRWPPSRAGDGPVQPGSSGVESSRSIRKPGADLEIGDGAGWRC